MPLNINPWKEFWILIAGPIFQSLAAYLLILFLKDKEKLILIYHHSILLFNLLPIYPLDGGKLIRLLLELFFPYKRSYKIILIISYLLLLGYIGYIHNITINNIIMFLVLIFLITKEYQKIDLIYQKFLLERYLKNYSFKKNKLIQSEQDFYRNKSHLLKLREQYVFEKDFLTEKYKKKT